ncbi:MAG: hypothetical protein WC413_01635 [Candidatus Nanoarchaeia archaeon]
MDIIGKMALEKNTDVFFKAEYVRLVVRTITQLELSTKTIMYHLSRIRNQKYYKYELAEIEKKIKEGMEKFGISPITAFNYLDTTLIPEHYKEKIKNKMLSPKRAKMLNANVLKREKACLGLEILEMGRKLIGRLDENV